MTKSVLSNSATIFGYLHWKHPLMPILKTRSGKNVLWLDVCCWTSTTYSCLHTVSPRHALLSMSVLAPSNLKTMKKLSNISSWLIPSWKWHMEQITLIIKKFFHHCCQSLWNMAQKPNWINGLLTTFSNKKYNFPSNFYICLCVVLVYWTTLPMMNANSQLWFRLWWAHRQF